VIDEASFTARALAAMKRAATGDGDLVPAVILSSPTFDTILNCSRIGAVLRTFNLEVARLTARDAGRSQ
jgi:hypothetical protein